jgi:hypothetical protein
MTILHRIERLVERLTEIRDDKPTGAEIEVIDGFLSKRPGDAVTLEEIRRGEEVLNNHLFYKPQTTGHFFR